VIEGDQGLGKSHFAQALAFDVPDWFTDGLNSDLANKETLFHLQGKLVVELSELSALKKTSIEETKRFISKRVDRYRPFYGKREISVARRCVFIGTTNAHDYLIDVTGNRRFLPVMARAVDLDGFRIDRAQIFAEAIARYRAGEQWWLDPEETGLAEIEQLARLQDDAWEDPLRRSIGDNRHMSRGDLFVTVTDAFNWLGIDISKRNKSEYDRIARILRKIGGEPQRRQTKADRQRGFYFPAIEKPEG
jgi:putative DNA primase/helicase